ADDTVQAGDGDNVVVGDNGRVSLFGGKLLSVVSTDTAIGDVDRVTTGSGNDVVVGGLAGDTVDAGDGANVVLGDSGEVDYQSGTGVLLQAFSTAAAFGGDDSLTSGVGADVVIGGIGGDTIVANNGETGARPDGVDVVVGDNGQVVFNGPDG